MRLRHITGIVVLLFTLTLTPGSGWAKSDQYESLKRFSQALHLIENNYVRQIGREELIKGAIQGMLQDLDPHSAFFNPEKLQRMQEDMSGEFSGIGIQIGMKDNRLVVIAPIEDTPAYRVGLKAGDLILAIDGESTQGISLSEAVEKIRGKKGDPVELTIMHEDAQRPERIKIIRDTIPLHTVKLHKLEDGYVHLRITDFKSNTTDELKKAMSDLPKKEQIKGMILDLRNNPGGLLSQAISVADIFLSDDLIVYTQGREKESRKNFYAEKEKNDISCPLVVLINAGSASASEIVAGALQDHKRALLVGEKTFGKGSVQSIIPLADGSAIKMTVALYYTPEGRSIQAEGIEPDFVLPFEPAEPEDDEEGHSSLREQDLTRHLENPNEKTNATEKDKNINGEKIIKNDNQLRMGLQLLKSMPAIKELKNN
ncbi:MAG: S41 family peptidase [Desulfovibrionales bacterium]